MAGDEDLYQIAALLDQLKHDDVALRVNASSNLVRISNALGPERTRNELVPFLEETTDDDDEVLVVIAGKIGEMSELVGGAEHVHCLLGPLELLATVEESTVRNATLQSAEMIAGRMSDAHIGKYYMPFVLKLATKDWFTARITATGLFHFVYKRLDEGSARTFRSTFLRLCMDDSPVVRRHAMMSIGEMAQMVNKNEVTSEFMGVFSSVASDEHDSVRIQVIPACAKIAKVVPDDVRASQILPVVMSLCGDKAWRVRWSIATQLPDIAASLGKEITNGSLATVFEALLNDTEAEVRVMAAANISKMCALLGKEKIVSKILSATQRLVTDSSENARASLAGVINNVASELGRNDTVTHLLPMLLLLLRDETADVRLNIISNLSVINQVVGVELLSQSLLPAIVDLSEDNKWRVRLAIIQHIPQLAQQLGKPVFNEKLSDLSLNWLGDDVYTIRRAAADNLQKLVDYFGEEWAIHTVLPRVEALRGHKNYLKRMTCLYSMQTLVKSKGMTAKGLRTHVLPAVLEMEKDPVPNVRFNSARTLAELYARLKADKLGSEDWEAELVASLRRLVTDTDRDVRYFSTQALDELPQ